MNNEQRVIRLQADGPEGIDLERMQLDPAEFQSPLPEQFGHVYYADEELGLTVGVWTTTSTLVTVYLDAAYQCPWH